MRQQTVLETALRKAMIMLLASHMNVAKSRSLCEPPFSCLLNGDHSQLIYLLLNRYLRSACVLALYEYLLI